MEEKETETRLYYDDYKKSNPDDNNFMKSLLALIFIVIIIILVIVFCINFVKLPEQSNTKPVQEQPTTAPSNPQISKEQILKDYPILYPIKWNWIDGDYIEKNTFDTKQKISNEFMKILKDEEKALDNYISKNEIQANKNKAFLKHMNNVEAVTKNLAQVVDWIIDSELPSVETKTTLTKTLYGINYRFISELISDEGEEFYAYAKVAPTEYPMINMRLDYVGTELHIVATVNKDYYIKKYTGNIDNKTLELYKSTRQADLAKLDFSEE